jgi:sialic acid synthase SpsE/mannose-6-phosphate isomerase-like protein (cupin superfamily)
MKNSKPLIIYEMANNHQGSVEHGKKIINELKEVSSNFDFDFAIKFQYRNLDTFIHPDYQDRMDLKFVKRFKDTQITSDERIELKDASKNAGFLTICTPFDEVSVDKVVEHGYDYLKVASCSARDWPLLDKISKAGLPVISSTGGATLEDVDKIVSLFSHNKVDFKLMHCVGVYPTPNEDLQLNRIDWFKERYPEVEIGFSTHETPGELIPVAMAVAKGARIFEKHVGLEDKNIELNAYSCSPNQIHEWLNTIKKAIDISGVSDSSDYKITQAELDGLKDLKRGVFTKVKKSKGDEFNQNDVFFAMPIQDGQMTSEFCSKHNINFTLQGDIEINDPVMNYDISEQDLQPMVVSDVIHKVKSQLNQARIHINKDSDIELSHHYGIEEIRNTGAVLISCINEEYCKKIIVMIPGQSHPGHRHNQKKESFQVLWGRMTLAHEGKEQELVPGDIVTILPTENHSFKTDIGVIFEEVSTTDIPGDSIYTDDSINKNSKRKTKLSDLWLRF